MPYKGVKNLFSLKIKGNLTDEKACFITKI